MLDGDEIVYVARVPTKRIMTINLAIGSRLPAYPTSMGRVLLAGLAPAELDGYFDRVRLEPLTERTVTDEGVLRRLIDEVREQGWAIVDQELEEGVRSVAAPLVNAEGRVEAALNVSGHATRVTLDTLRRGSCHGCWTPPGASTPTSGPAAERTPDRPDGCEAR